MQADMNIGMLGHVDHGKTTLTKALTGKWTDTHSEELKRGISIRLGYADARIYYNKEKDAYSPTPQPGFELLRKVSIVDAPGHETLMTTVISATSILDGVIFLIAANEKCPQPQTLEHLLVLNSMGVSKVIVVQTKVDLVSKERARENYREIKAFLKGSVAEDAPIIPVVANKGVNIDELLRAIHEVMKPPQRDPSKELRMYVSRSFDVNLPGTPISKLKGGVLGGSIVQGVVKVGEEIEVKPGVWREGKPEALTTKVRSLREENEDLKEAKPGGLIAVGTDIDPAITKSDNLVGCIVGRKGKVPDPVHEVEVEYEILKRPNMESLYLRENEPVVLGVHTATTVGLITKLSKPRAHLRLKKPVVVYKGMRAAILKRVGQRWMLAAWGKVVG